MYRRLFLAELKIVTASTEKLFRILQSSGILVYDLRMDDELTVRFFTPAVKLKVLQKLFSSNGIDYEVLSNHGFIHNIKSLRKRPILVIGLVCFIVLTMYLPTRVFFIQVQGTKNLNPQSVLQAAQQCGIRFGASRQDVRSENVKNGLLHLMPELKWAGIKTSGCTAIISVVERERAHKTDTPTVSDIIAAKDGTICQITVTGGNQQCQLGESVQMGQVLISGSNDLGLAVLKQRAEGEVYAFTTFELEAVYMHPVEKNEKTASTENTYALLLGKKLINLWNYSGNSDSTCGKLYKQSYVELPGGFELPVALLTVSQNDQSQYATVQDSVENLLRQYVLSQMIAGQILSAEPELYAEDGTDIIRCTYYCREMIGKEVKEELFPEYEQRN